MLHAEHGGGNNSAFACRVLSSSGTDTYSAPSPAAVGSLKGPLHGGANAKVMEQFRTVKANVRPRQDDASIKDYLLQACCNKEAGDQLREDLRPGPRGVHHLRPPGRCC